MPNLGADSKNPAEIQISRPTLQAPCRFKVLWPAPESPAFFISFALFSWNTANYDECEGDLSLVIVIVYLECPAARVTSGLSMTLPEHIQLPRGIVINFPLRALSTVALTCQPMPPNMATLSSRPHCDR